jgi:ATP-dependent Clp protease ATP-binding subunit ClpA/transcriptional regulator with XRE-family HTH domain
MADFNTFSPAAQRALQFTRAAAERMGHRSIGSEHLLLGIVEERDDLAVYLLNLLDVRLKPLVRMIRAFVDPGEQETGVLHLTDHARTALEIAVRERLRLGHTEVGTVHLLLGILDVPDCVAVKVLGQMGVDIDDLSAALRTLYEPDGDRPPIGPVLERLRDARLEYGDQEQAPVHAELSGDELAGRSKLILQLAQSSARTLQHDMVGTDHLLAGLVAEGDGAAAQVLAAMGLTEKRVILAVRFGRGLQSLRRPFPSGLLPLSPRAQNALALARFRALGARSAGGVGLQRMAGRLQKPALLESGDILLGLLDEGHGAAVTILESFGLDASEIRSRLQARARWRSMAVRPKAQEPASLWEWTNLQLIKRNWSLGDLGQHGGIRKSTARQWLHGERRPTGDSCDALAAAFGADPNTVRRLANRPAIPYRPKATPNGVDAIRALFDQIYWDDDRIARMTALLEAMVANNQERKKRHSESA